VFIRTNGRTDKHGKIEYIDFSRSETIPFICNIIVNEYSLPFSSTTHGYTTFNSPGHGVVVLNWLHCLRHVQRKRPWTWPTTVHGQCVDIIFAPYGHHVPLLPLHGTVIGARTPISGQAAVGQRSVVGPLFTTTV